MAVGTASPVVLTEQFRRLAAAWQVPVETLAAYVLEEWGDTHCPDRPLVLIVDKRK